MAKNRKQYDAGFKRKAVELSHVRGNVKEVAEDLGILPEVLYRWRREHKSYQHNSFPGKGKPKLTDGQREVLELKKQLRNAELERDILKKAVAIFSRSDRKSSGS
jgi:transposase